MLAWSFNRDGEARQDLIDERDRALNVDTQSVRRERRELVRHANPQEGVDALKGQFKGPSEPIEGVIAKKSEQQ